MRLLVTRHGETQWNLLGKINGVTDVTLTPAGQMQAAQLGEKLLLERVGVIISSPLKRAAQTAEIAGGILGVSPIYDERLREINVGDFEGDQRNNPEYLRAKSRLAVRFPGGGESTLQVAHRLYHFLEDIWLPYRDKTVLIVAHGGICRILASYFCDMENEAFSASSVNNCQLQEYWL